MQLNCLRAVADRVEIEALRGEFTDAVMMRDYDRLASLFTEDGAVRMPHIDAASAGQEEIRTAAERLQDLWDYFVQTTHPGTIRIEGDTASGRTYISEFGRLQDGSSHLNYAVYHDRYQRTPEGWKFAERVYEIKYLDTTPLPGSAPTAGGRAEHGGRHTPLHGQRLGVGSGAAGIIECHGDKQGQPVKEAHCPSRQRDHPREPTD